MDDMIERAIGKMGLFPQPEEGLHFNDGLLLNIVDSDRIFNECVDETAEEIRFMILLSTESEMAVQYPLVKEIIAQDAAQLGTLRYIQQCLRNNLDKLALDIGSQIGTKKAVFVSAFNDTTRHLRETIRAQVSLRGSLEKKYDKLNIYLQAQRDFTSFITASRVEDAAIETVTVTGTLGLGEHLEKLRQRKKENIKK